VNSVRLAETNRFISRKTPGCGEMLRKIQVNVSGVHDPVMG
jgi:hypothetical protein